MRPAYIFLLATLLTSPFLQRTRGAPPVSEEVELRSRVFGNTRTLRILLPPSYNDPGSATTRYQVCYFTDGRAAFDPNGWDVPGTATRLWAGHEIPEIIFVGIDNGGSTRESQSPVLDRASEFLPYADPSWTGQPGPTLRGDRQPAFLFTEVMPLINQRYRTRSPTACLAGASYGAIAALYVGIHFPDSVGGLLLESPSLQVGNGQLLRDAEAVSRWPRCTYLGVGTAEGQTATIQAEMLRNATSLSHTLPARTSRFVVTPKAPHSFAAWGERLPAALRYLLGPGCRGSGAP